MHVCWSVHSHETTHISPRPVQTDRVGFQCGNFEFTDENSKNDSLCLLYRSIPYNLLTVEPFVMQYSLSVLHVVGRRPLVFTGAAQTRHEFSSQKSWNQLLRMAEIILIRNGGDFSDQ